MHNHRALTINFNCGGGGSTSIGKPIWLLAADNNKKPLKVTKRTVSEADLKYRPYHGVFL